MKKAIIVLVAALAACGSTAARPRHWYTDVRWWAGEAVIVGSVVADAQSSCAGFAHGAVESSILDRGGHSCQRTSLMLLAAGSGYTLGHVFSYKLVENDPSRALRVARYFTMPAVVVAVHVTAAIHNYNSLPTR